MQPLTGTCPIFVRQKWDCPLLPAPATTCSNAVRLGLIDGVGPLTRRKLLARFGSAAAVLAAAPSDLRQVEGVGPTLAARIAAADRIDAQAEIDLCAQHGIQILTESDPRYPRMLREIHDPPGLLFVQGTLAAADGLAIGIVGTRHATAYGLRQAERLAGSLSRAGLTIVSGLARGIDAVAHRAALEAGGRTLAVMASGVLHIYPPEHDALARQIAGCGALLSEQPPRSAPWAAPFHSGTASSAAWPWACLWSRPPSAPGPSSPPGTPWSRAATCSPCPATSTAAPPAAATA